VALRLAHGEPGLEPFLQPVEYLGDGGLRDAMPSGGCGKTSGFNQISEHPQGFHKHDDSGLHQKMIAVNSDPEGGGPGVGSIVVVSSRWLDSLNTVKIGAERRRYTFYT